jgi:hypothetical protein
VPRDVAGRAAGNYRLAACAPQHARSRRGLTGRTSIGGVTFAKTADDADSHAERMLAMKVGLPVGAVLAEEKIDIDREFFLSFGAGSITLSYPNRPKYARHANKLLILRTFNARIAHSNEPPP